MIARTKKASYSVTFRMPDALYQSYRTLAEECGHDLTAMFITGLYQALPGLLLAQANHRAARLYAGMVEPGDVMAGTASDKARSEAVGELLQHMERIAALLGVADKSSQRQAERRAG